jgi:hypothetical protein
VLGKRPNQLERRRDDVQASVGALLDVSATGVKVTRQLVERTVAVEITKLRAGLGLDFAEFLTVVAYDLVA